MSNYVCSNCGQAAGYDGRCGDGAYLVCGCDRENREWVNDGRGGYYTNPSNAHPVATGLDNNSADDDRYNNDPEYREWVFKSDR